TQFGHHFKTHVRASLRSDNCPNTSDHCPTIIGLGVRIHRNAHVFTHALTPPQILELYTAGLNIAPVQLHVQRIGTTLYFNWLSGALQQADEVAGPYSDVSEALSPFPVAPTANQKFYRVKEQ
ncbi:MAG: hypothetical protein KA118_10650, partial [Verrucomicrobia bacterium]|nr:hypothetical protein [Verrucomicrobiota bacterium]